MTDPLEAAARAETARIYSTTCPEHRRGPPPKTAQEIDAIGARRLLRDMDETEETGEGRTA